MKWIVSNSHYSRETWLVDADERLHGICDFVGAKWHPPVQRYGMTMRQLDIAERLIDAGWLARTIGVYGQHWTVAYHVDNPEDGYEPEQLADVLALIPEPPKRCPKTKELPL